MELQDLQKVFSFLNAREFAKENSLDYNHLIKLIKGEKKLTDKMAAKIKVGIMDLHKIFENYIKK